jgi:hypothetical protein
MWMNYFLLCIAFWGLVKSVTAKTEPVTSPRETLLRVSYSEKWLEYDLTMIRHQAYELRNRSWCIFGEQWFEGFHGVVAPVLFEDGEKWAVKITRNTSALRKDITNGHKCIALVEQYCPDIPVPKVKSDLMTSKSGSLVYYFMEWIDGIPLDEDPFFKQVRQTENDLDHSTGVPRVIVSIPDKTVKQLAAFAYNITTCPIPNHECKSVLHFSH